MRIKLSLLLLLFGITGVFAQPDQRIARVPKINYDWKPGFVSITEVTGAPGLGLTNDGLSKYYYGITTMAGYQFSRNIRAGGGLGIHIHEDATLFPLYFDVRMNLNSQEFVPFIGGSGGIMLDMNEFGNTRVFINPSLGMRYVAASKKAITFSTGLMITTGGPAQRKSFINLKLGFELKGK